MKYKAGDWVKFKSRDGREIKNITKRKIINLDKDCYTVEYYRFKYVYVGGEYSDEYSSELVWEKDIIDKLTDEEIFLAKLENE